MIIWQDTREQEPLDFSGFDIITEVKESKLDCGDYCIQFKNGFIPNLRFERKSIPDLFGTLGKGHKRFKQEIERANTFSIKLILLIEGSLSEVDNGTYYSTIEGGSIIKTVFSLWERYGVYPIFAKDRAECARYIVEIGSAIGRKAIRDLKESKNGYKKT